MGYSSGGACPHYSGHAPQRVVAYCLISGPKLMVYCIVGTVASLNGLTEWSAHSRSTRSRLRWGTLLVEGLTLNLDVPNSNGLSKLYQKKRSCKLGSPCHSESCTDGCIVRVPPAEVLDQRDDADGHTHNDSDVHLGGYSTTVVVIVVTVHLLCGGQ